MESQIALEAFTLDGLYAIEAGETEEETTGLMKEAIEFRLERLKEDKIPIPEPTISARCVEAVV
jgi:predicted RNase H-like HicB family nuclease